MRSTVNLKTVLIGVAVLAASFFISLKAMDWLAPRAASPAPPVAQLPPLPPASKSSIVIAPVAIALSAIREQAEKAAPRNFAGKADNPISQILENADSWCRIETGLMRQANGHVPAPPGLETPPSTGRARARAVSGEAPRAPRWATRIAVFLYLKQFPLFCNELLYHTKYL